MKSIPVRVLSDFWVGFNCTYCAFNTLVPIKAESDGPRVGKSSLKFRSWILFHKRVKKHGVGGQGADFWILVLFFYAIIRLNSLWSCDRGQNQEASNCCKRTAKREMLLRKTHYLGLKRLGFSSWTFHRW